jgi:hypothetical protein
MTDSMGGRQLLAGGHSQRYDHRTSSRGGGSPLGAGSVLHPARKMEINLGARIGGIHHARHYRAAKNEPIGELYDLQVDPHEDRNLYIDKPDIVAG